MKWVYLLGIVLLAPALAMLLRSNRRYLAPACFVLGVSMLLIGPGLWTAVYGWPTWPAPVKGLEVSFVDAVAVALLASTKRVPIPFSFKLSLGIICLALVISTAASQNRVAAAFYIWELLRTVLLFVAIARACATDTRAAIALVAGLALAMVFEPIWMLTQHVDRPGGSLGHSNTFGIAADFVMFPALALLFGGRRPALPAAAVAAGLVCAILGGSRASLGLFTIGVVLTTVFSIFYKRSSRKYALAGVLAVLFVAAVPVLIWAPSHRSQQDLASSDQQRAAMKEAARMIVADHPLGIGANQYVVVANVGGYSARAGVDWNWATRNAPVHDTYYLVTAEMSFIGLIGILAMFGSVLTLGFRTLRRPIQDESGELVPGLLAAMIIVSIHISYEFAFMDFMLHYLFAMCAGMLVAIAARTKEAARAPARAALSPRALAPAT